MDRKISNFRAGPPLLLLISVLAPACGQMVGPPQFEAPQALNANSFTDFDDDFFPRLAAKSQGEWMVVWYSFENLGGSIGHDGDILLSTSGDNGQTWTSPRVLNANAAEDSGIDLAPFVVPFDGGRWLAIWRSNEDFAGVLGADYDLLYSRSADFGLTWTDPLPLNSNAAVDTGFDNRPRHAVDATGLCMVVWQSTENLNGTLGEDWDVLVTRSADQGATWEELSVLNSNAASDTGEDWFPQIATDRRGTWICVWASDDPLGGTIGDDFDILISRSTDEGLTWSDPIPLNTNAGSDLGDDVVLDLGLFNDGPKLATDGRGCWVSVWSSRDSLENTIGEDADIFVARSLDNGITWSGPAPLTERMRIDDVDGSSADHVPYIATDGNGIWIVTWESLDDLGGRLPGDPDVDIFYSVSRDQGGTWTDSAPLNTNAASDSGSDNHPVIETDGQGNWIVTWTSAEAEFGGGGGVLGEFDIVFSRAFFKNALPAPVWKMYR